MEALMRRLYYDTEKSPVAFTSGLRLYQAARKEDSSITQRKVRQWLDSQKTYNVHKLPKRKFQRQITRCSGIYTDLQVNEN
jgi:hypothetical protein